MALVGITYLLLAQSLRDRDHELIQSTLDRYSTEYRMGGLQSLNRAISIDRVEGRHARLFVRVLNAQSESIFFNVPADWPSIDLSQLELSEQSGSTSWLTLAGERASAVLEVASTKLSDGTLFQGRACLTLVRKGKHGRLKEPPRSGRFWH